MARPCHGIWCHFGSCPGDTPGLGLGCPVPHSPQAPPAAQGDAVPTRAGAGAPGSPGPPGPPGPSRGWGLRDPRWCHQGWVLCEEGDGQRWGWGEGAWGCHRVPQPPHLCPSPLTCVPAPSPAPQPPHLPPNHLICALTPSSAPLPVPQPPEPFPIPSSAPQPPHLPPKLLTCPLTFPRPPHLCRAPQAEPGQQQQPPGPAEQRALSPRDRGATPGCPPPQNRHRGGATRQPHPGTAGRGTG